MTILNATLTPAFAIVSQDTGAFTPEGELIGHVEKLTIIRPKHMVIGARGALAFAAAWAAAIPCRDVDDIATVPAALRRLRDRIPCHPEQTVLHVGWSHATNTPAGFVFTAATDFEPQPLIPGAGHLIAPATLATDEPDYPALASMGNAAATGDNAEAFHIALAQNQHKADMRGLMGSVGHIGGTLSLVTIDASGITKRTVNAFTPSPKVEGRHLTAGALLKAAGEKSVSGS